MRRFSQQRYKTHRSVNKTAGLVFRVYIRRCGIAERKSRSDGIPI